MLLRHIKPLCGLICQPIAPSVPHNVPDIIRDEQDSRRTERDVDESVDVSSFCSRVGIPVRGYDKWCSLENVEFVGIAA